MRWPAWTARQRGLLVGLLAVLLLVLSLRYWGHPARVDDHALPVSEDLLEGLDPNTAGVAAMASLPGIGPEQAEEIVAYRRQFIDEGRGRAAFTQPEDLLQVRGLGPGTLDILRPHLRLPATSPSR